jgi:hypothetical protein
MTWGWFCFGGLIIAIVMGGLGAALGWKINDLIREDEARARERADQRRQVELERERAAGRSEGYKQALREPPDGPRPTSWERIYRE